MKHFLAMLRFYLRWLVYCHAVSDEKFLHSMAHCKGMRAVRMFWDGCAWVVVYDPNFPPQPRSWLTFEEYRIRWHPRYGTRVKR